jgi:hypothetical protein
MGTENHDISFIQIIVGYKYLEHYHFAMTSYLRLARLLAALCSETIELRDLQTCIIR